MTKTELTDWHHKEFWPLYKELCKTPFPTKWDGGVRGKSCERLIKINPSQELRERIVLAVQAQIKHRKDLYQKLGSMQVYNNYTKYKTFYCNRAGDAWLNQKGWDDEIPTIHNESEAEAVSRLCQCGRPTLGPKIDSCSECLHRTDEREIHEERKKTMERLGLLKYAHDKPLYYQKCREYVTKKTGSLIPDKTVNDCKGCKEKLSIVAGMHVNDKGVKVMECKAWKRLQGVL